MIMDIMAFFGIFHNFLRCLSLYSCVTFPPLWHSLLFSVLAWKQQCLKEMPTITLLRVLLYAGSFHLIPSIKRSNKRRSLEMSSNTPSIWAFFEEILSPSKRSFPCSVISRLSSSLLFFTVWQKVTANVSNDSQVFFFFFTLPKTTRLKDVLQCQMSWKVLLTVEVVRNNLCIFVWPSVQAYRSRGERFQTAGVV